MVNLTSTTFYVVLTVSFLFQILRDELRKLQSGVLLSEKQRNPGVGYFASPSFSLATPQTTSAASIPLSPSVSEAGTPTRTGSVSSEMNRMDSASNGDEALNFEYIRNVILQFLERPEMRVSYIIYIYITSSSSLKFLY